VTNKDCNGDDSPITHQLRVLQNKARDEHKAKEEYALHQLDLKLAYLQDNADEMRSSKRAWAKTTPSPPKRKREECCDGHCWIAKTPVKGEKDQQKSANQKLKTTEQRMRGKDDKKAAPEKEPSTPHSKESGGKQPQPSQFAPSIPVECRSTGRRYPAREINPVSLACLGFSDNEVYAEKLILHANIDFYFIGISKANFRTMLALHKLHGPETDPLAAEECEFVARLSSVPRSAWADSDKTRMARIKVWIEVTNAASKEEGTRIMALNRELMQF
jgi:hypothetical protein